MCFIMTQALRMVMMYFQTSVTRMKANKASEMSQQQWTPAIGQAQEISIASQSEHNNIITVSMANTMQNIPEQMSRSKQPSPTDG